MDTPAPVKKSSKNKITAVLLAVFFGWLGAHKFYLRRIGWGVFYVLMFPVFPVIVAISWAEALILTFMPRDQFDAKFNTSAPPKKPTRTMAAFLAILCGSFGVHRFYLREVLWGLAYLLLTLIGGGWGFTLFTNSEVYRQTITAYQQGQFVSLHGATWQIPGMGLPAFLMLLPIIGGVVEGFWLLLGMSDEQFEERYVKTPVK